MNKLFESGFSGFQDSQDSTSPLIKNQEYLKNPENPENPENPDSNIKVSNYLTKATNSSEIQNESHHLVNHVHLALWISSTS
jgi:hypothetical protein